MAERYKVELGRAIAARRKELGMTQKNLADATHYKEAQSVSRWERGENLPSDLEVVARALDWTLADLTAGIQPPSRRVARQFGIAVDDRDTPDLSGPGEPAWVGRLEEKLDYMITRLGGDPEKLGTPEETLAETVARLTAIGESSRGRALGQPKTPRADRKRKTS